MLRRLMDPEEDDGGRIVLIVIVILVLFSAPFLFAPMMAALSAVGFWALFGLDAFLGAHLIPRAPWVMWAFAGAMVGGFLGFWTIAPAYGMKEQRKLLGYVPFLILIVIMVFGLGAMSKMEDSAAVRPIVEQGATEATRPSAIRVDEAGQTP